MPWIIPQDWDGETWECVQLQWPDSPAFMGILRGLITVFRRGREWDEKTGVVRDAQEIGWQIFDKNWPLTFCDECHPPEQSEHPAQPPGGDVSGFLGLLGCLLEQELIMLSSGPCPPIKIENGKLYWWQCCEWVEVGEIAQVTQALPELPAWDDAGPFYRCGKASAIVAAMWALATAVWGNKDGLDYFLSIGAIDNSLPAWDLSNMGILGLLNGARSLDDVYTQADFLSEVTKQRLLCTLAPQLTADGDPITEDQYELIKAIVASTVESDSVYWWQGLVDTIGYRSLREISLQGATDGDADCSCPAGYEDAYSTPTFAGWYLSAPLDDITFENSGSGSADFYHEAAPEHDIFGVMYELSMPNGVADIKHSGPSGCTGWSLWASNSSQFGGPIARMFTCAASVAGEIMPNSQYTRVDAGQSWSTNPASPNQVADTQICMHWYVDDGPITVQIKSLRWIFNINSPSHG